MRIQRNWWNLHTHSKYSVNDALPEVKDIVETVAGYGQKAIGLTDHGNMGGSVQLYKHAQRLGLKPFPGTELYIVEDRKNKKAKRHHMCVVAYTTYGYENLTKINSMANENFFHKPLLDHVDLAQLSSEGLLEGIAATSGCYFGLISQAIVKEESDRAAQLMTAYSQWFDRFYVELQNHNIDHGEDGWNDDKLADALLSLANEQGIPCVITQDSHYCHPEDKPTHETLKRLVSYGTGEDAVFPGDGFHLADSEWFESHHPKERRKAGLEGLKDLYDAHDLSIRQLDSYSYNIPFTVDDPDRALSKIVDEELNRRGLGQKYVERMNDELSIVNDTGMAGYLLLVAAVTDWCQQNRVFYQARGSASGSLLCWLLDITQVDPIAKKLRFERFISRDRTKPPDIDLDIEHVKRQELIAYLDARYAVHQIGTWLEYSMKQDENEEGKGSLLIRYYAKMRAATGNKVTWADVPDEDKRQLRILSDKRVFSSYGTHAAGLVVTTTRDEFEKLIPTMKVASSKTFVTQYEMGDVETLGLVKLDILGLKTLTAVHKCFDYLDRDVFGGFDWIPDNDKETLAMISKGDTAGVFQLEGKASKYGCMNMKPKKVDDLIAAMAIFRPATLQSGATASFIARKHKKEEIPQRHPIINKVTKDTHGIMVYQEQVIEILREVGMTPDDLTAFLKAVKASNADIGDAGKVILSYRESLRAMCESHGMEDDDWKWLWNAIEGFAAYGFNKAHATAYGLLAYRTAYLACHHPVQYFAALLSTYSGDKKEQEYRRACRSKGIRIKPTHINESDVSYAVDSTGRNIREGIGTIKGIGPKAAERIVMMRPRGGYESKEHFAKTVGSRVSGVKPFMESGDETVGQFAVLNEAGMFNDF